MPIYIIHNMYVYIARVRECIYDTIVLRLVHTRMSYAILVCDSFFAAQRWPATDDALSCVTYVMILTEEKHADGYPERNEYIPTNFTLEFDNNNNNVTQRTNVNELLRFFFYSIRACAVYLLRYDNTQRRRRSSVLLCRVIWIRGSMRGNTI